MGLKTESVESDTGNMGGDVAHEFQVLSDAGEDRLIFCTKCEYRGNMEKETRKLQQAPAAAKDVPARSDVATPGVSNIEALTKTLGVAVSDLMKKLLIR